MRATLPWLGVVLGVALAAPCARAQCYVPYIPKAPDMCGPGNYGPNWAGLLYGPNYCVFPPFPPYQGELAGPHGPGGGPGGPPGQITFPQHPFARGPRDFFMIYAPGGYARP
jgi:hypothetical protein